MTGVGRVALTDENLEETLSLIILTMTKICVALVGVTGVIFVAVRTTARKSRAIDEVTVVGLVVARA